MVEDPYALSPDRAAEPDLGVERDLDWVSYDSGLGRWVGPFLMAGLNTRVVRRSNALQDWAYGRRFQYREVTGFGTSPAAAVQAAAFSTALKAAAAGLAFGPSRALLGQLLPVLGEGPSEKTRRTGFFRMQIHTRTSAGVRYLAKIEARGDPGYAATSVMLGESALCLALDRDRLPDHAGVLDTSNGDGCRARRPAQIGGPHPRGATDHPVTAAPRQHAHAPRADDRPSRSDSPLRANAAGQQLSPASMEASGYIRSAQTGGNAYMSLHQ